MELNYLSHTNVNYNNIHVTRLTCELTLACRHRATAHTFRAPSDKYTRKNKNTNRRNINTKNKWIHRQLSLKKNKLFHYTQYRTQQSLFMALPYRAVDGWALPSPWGDDTYVVLETSSGSSRSHFYSIFYHLRSGDGRLRLAACWRSFPSSSSTDCAWKPPDLKFPNLCNVNREVMYELEKKAD